MSETIMFPTNYELVVKDKATAMQYAISQARVYNKETMCYDLDLEFAKSIFKLFCGNVELSDVANGGCCVECIPPITEEELQERIKEYIETNDKNTNANGNVLTYDDVEKQVLNGIYTESSIQCYNHDSLKKIQAINKIMIVAKYLNGEWKPDWEDTTRKFTFLIDEEDDLLIPHQDCRYNSFVYFKTEELAKRAIDILGEKTIRLALSTDY